MPRSHRPAIALALCAALTTCVGGSRGPVNLPSASLPGDLPGLLRIADDVSEGSEKILRRALAAARRALEIDGSNYDALWRAARACYFLADAASDRDLQARFATEGIALAERGVAADPNRVESHYFLALNLGALARTQPTGALGLVARIAAAGKRALELSPDYERAGPLRLLGLLYAKAPPWPTSVGDIDEAVRLLRRAVERFPDEPLNRLFLAEALIADRRYDAAEKELRIVLAAPPEGEWARVGRKWRKQARHLLRRIGVARHHRE